MYEKRTEKKTCESCASARQNRQPRRISALFSKLPQKSPTKLGAAVFALIVLHFAAQLVFFQNDKKTAHIEQQPSFEIQMLEEAKPVEAVTVPVVEAPSAKKPESEVAAPAVIKTAPVRKKEPPRETESQRLRRAERILTGA